MSGGEIIAVFSCAGKSHFVHQYFRKFDCVDHDMYDFAFASSRRIRENWVEHYLQRMHFLRKKYSIVFVNAEPSILAKLPSTTMIVYPKKELKAEYIARARARGASEFYKILEEKWDEWIDACENHKSKYKCILEEGEYLQEWMLDNDEGYKEFLAVKYNDEYDEYEYEYE